MNKLHLNTNIFRILVFSDLHYGENDLADNQSSVFQMNMINQEQPDIVIFNGDMSSEYAASGDKWEWWTAQWSKYTSVVRDKQIPYALNIGNHDIVVGTALDILEYDRIHGYPYSYTKASLVQFIPILITNNNTNHSQYYIWLLSSGVDSVDVESVKKWSSNNSRGQMFVHIPLPETLSLTDKQGVHNEFIACSSQNTGLLARVILDGHVDCIWHGHDHLNNYIGFITWHDHYNNYFGYETQQTNKQCIGSARKSGYGGYNGLQPGATVIDITDNGKQWSSRVRLDDFSIVHLHEYTGYFWVHLQVACDISLQSTVLVILAVTVLKLICLLGVCVIRMRAKRHVYTRVSSTVE